jgi:hypothetical protein
MELILEPPNPPLRLSGVVAYATPDGLGIRFADVSPEQRLLLRDYVNVRGIGISRPSRRGAKIQEILQKFSKQPIPV